MSNPTAGSYMQSEKMQAEIDDLKLQLARLEGKLEATWKAPWVAYNNVKYVAPIDNRAHRISCMSSWHECSTTSNTLVRNTL